MKKPVYISSFILAIIFSILIAFGDGFGEEFGEIRNPIYRKLEMLGMDMDNLQIEDLQLIIDNPILFAEAFEGDDDLNKRCLELIEDNDISIFSSNPLNNTIYSLVLDQENITLSENVFSEDLKQYLDTKTLDINNAQVLKEWSNSLLFIYAANYRTENISIIPTSEISWIEGLVESTITSQENPRNVSTEQYENIRVHSACSTDKVNAHYTTLIPEQRNDPMFNIAFFNSSTFNLPRNTTSLVTTIEVSNIQIVKIYRSFTEKSGYRLDYAISDPLSGRLLNIELSDSDILELDTMVERYQLNNLPNEMKLEIN